MVLVYNHSMSSLAFSCTSDDNDDDNNNNKLASFVVVDLENARDSFLFLFLLASSARHVKWSKSKYLVNLLIDNGEQRSVVNYSREKAWVPFRIPLSLDWRQEALKNFQSVEHDWKWLGVLLDSMRN